HPIDDVLADGARALDAAGVAPAAHGQELLGERERLDPAAGPRRGHDPPGHAGPLARVLAGAGAAPAAPGSSSARSCAARAAPECSSIARARARRPIAA